VDILIKLGPNDGTSARSNSGQGSAVNTRISSFYTPFWAGIENNWYKNSALDAVWKPEYDVLIEQLVERHAPYIYPFAREVLRVIDEQNNTNFAHENKNHDYYILTRAYQMPRTRQRWLDALASEEGRIFVCPVCKKQSPVLGLHPDLIAQYGTNPPWCRTCNYVVGRYTKFWNDETKRRLSDVMRRLDEPRPCDLCGSTFSLEKQVFTYQSFGLKAVDLLYPNLFANICSGCFSQAFADHRRGSKKSHLAALYELFLLVGKIPTRDFASLFYLFRDRDSIVKLVGVLQKARTPAGYEDECGNVFAALVKAGILPKGSRKMKIGAMMLSIDEHLCLSIPEKEIDDFLFAQGIEHDKEVYYPNSNYRADWELFGSGSRTFVEYFGLMSNAAYADKARQKSMIASAHGIELIGIYPCTDWKSVILLWKTQKLKKD